MRWFTRIDGDLYEVRLLTKPHREHSLVTVHVIRLDRVTTIEYRELIADY